MAVDPAKHRVPIKEAGAHLDAIWRGLSYDEMVELGRQIEAGRVEKPFHELVVSPLGKDPESLV